MAVEYFILHFCISGTTTMHIAIILLLQYLNWYVQNLNHIAGPLER